MPTYSPCQPKLTCRLCASKNLHEIFRLPDTPPANQFEVTREKAFNLPRFPLSVNVCYGCSHYQLGHVVDPTLLFGEYAYTTGSSPALKQHFVELAKTIAERVVRRPQGTIAPRALEIGSNDGTLLYELQQLGFEVQGIEPGRALAEQSNERGVPTLHGFFDDAFVGDASAPFDIFVATNVLAHIDDLVGTLQRLRKCSHPGSVGVVEVQYMGAMLKGGLFDTIYHEHLDYHSARSFGSALARQGWNVNRIDEIPTHGGSLRFWVQRAGPYDVGSSSPVYVNEGKRSWVHEWHDLNGKITAEKTRLHALLQPFTRVLCYGAPAKLTSLMYGLDLFNTNNDSHLRFIGVIDDAPSKQYRFTPGMWLPILPATVLHDETYKPDAILITAWNYAAGIRKILSDAGVTVPIIVPFEEGK